MIMNQKGKGNDYFETPDYIFRQLDNIFHFNMDVAATSENTKVFHSFITEKEDALKTNWGGVDVFAIRHLVKKRSLSNEQMSKFKENIVLFV